MEAGQYSPLEEKINVLSHALGFVLSVIAFILMLIYASIDGNAWHIVSFSIYGASLIILYASSTLYHNAKNPVTRRKLRVLDHAAIYVLIAGSYTPFLLITLQDTTAGWVVFGLVWSFAIVGIVLKLFFTGRFNTLSTIMYVAMGWLAVFAIKPLIENLAPEGFFWLVLGGFFYTIGAILYSIKKLDYNHAIFHIFVLLGSFCHFMSVFFYVLPAK